MKKNKQPRILVLGGRGKLGRVVYKFLSAKFPDTVWATSRGKKPSGMFYLDVETHESDLKKIFSHLKSIDYVINCIGLLKNYSSLDELIIVNSLFPHKLSLLTSKYDVRLFHISTDGIFSKNCGRVFEDSPPSPTDAYGASKLLGELSKPHALTIRTSIIGLDPLHKEGLLEWIKHYSKKTIPGFTNQHWTGCTTLQLAQFFYNTIQKDSFVKLKKQSNVYHFTPINPTIKYEIVRIFSHLTHINLIIKKSKGIGVTRTLRSKYVDLWQSHLYTGTITKALKELLEYEKTIQ